MRVAYYLLFFILLIGSYPLLYAQDLSDERPEIELSLGTSVTAWIPGGIGGNGFTGIPLMVDFKYAAGRWIALGVTGGLHLGSSRSFWKQFNAMGNLYGIWYKGEHFRVYSGVGYGNAAGFVTADGSPCFGFQFTPAGVSFGGRFFGYAELGAGWMFFPLRAGVGWRF